MEQLTAPAYTVAWLCALPRNELVAATVMLDEEHDPLSPPAHDESSYTYGSINGHNVVIACMLPGQLGKVSASKLVSLLSQTFRNLKIILFVGVGSGVPRSLPPDNSEDDIHLGDVVIGCAELAGVPGVVQWDPTRYWEDGNTEPLGILDKPDRRLSNALGLLLRNRILGRTRFAEHLRRLQKVTGFSHPGLEHDKLFKSAYHHEGESSCSSHDRAQLAERPPRVNQDLIFHQGTILSGDTVIKDPQTRDEISHLYYNALCFETEAAGVMDDKRFLVIRGIADYADSHRNSLWQNYAAGTAAAFAREFLLTIPPRHVDGIKSLGEVNVAAISTSKVHFMVPFQRNSDLIGREQHIQSLETKLCVPNKFCRVALVGLVGIGKTRIALEYAFRHKNSDSVSVFWVQASTAERMERAYQKIAKEAGLAGAEDPKVNQLQLVKQWLENKDSGTWVMVIDHADDENLFYGDDKNRGQESFGSFQKLAQYFPRRSNGSILLTTRYRMLGVKFATVRGVITIPEMSISESKDLLVRNLEEGDHDDQDLTDLANILGNLPLALVQAAAFIKERSQSISDYLQMYRESDSFRISLLKRYFEDGERDSNIKNPVAVTWVMAFEQIRKSDPQAVELLSLMSVLDRHAIPKSLLLLDYEDVELEKSLGILKAFSLITPESSHQAFSLHDLAYLAMRSWLSINKKLDSWTEKALVLLSELFPQGTYETREMWMAYLPHARTVLNSDHLPSSENIAQATLLFSVSKALQAKGDYKAAEIMARKSLDLREKALGKRDPETLQSLGNLGLVFWRQGKNVEAEEVYRQVLDSSEEILGNEHLHTLNIVDNFGLVLQDQGKLEAAEELHRRALSAKEKILGKEHLNTLFSFINLGLVLDYQGKYEEAESLHRQALSGTEKSLGIEHPDTLTSVNNLASVLANQGKYEEAEKLHWRALSAREKILGKEHPDTLMSLSNIGIVLNEQGKYEAAEKVHRRALSTREKILGKEHPDTLMSLSDMGVVLGNQGKYEEAERLHRLVLSAREKTLGYEHPNTLSSINNLADVFSDQGKYDEAEKLYRRGLSAREKVLGERHPDMLTSINNLAHALQKQNLVEEAAMLYKRAQSDREILLGREPSNTPMSVNKSELVLGNQGNYKAAKRLHQGAPNAREKISEKHSGIQGDNPHDVPSWHSGSPGSDAEQSNSKSTSQQLRDSTPVPPDIRQLRFQSNGTVPSQSSLDGNEYSGLGMLDTVVIVGDSLSMINPVHSGSMGNNQVSRWSMLERSLEYIINNITTHNKVGVDIHFLKHPKQNGQNITELDVFLSKLRIVGRLLQNSSSSTNFLSDLIKAISPHLEKFRVWKAAMAERKSLKRPKPLNLIVITDSHASDDGEVTSYLTNVARQLDSMRAPPRQIGIQLVQIGDDEKATSWFRKLEDDLGNGKFRDIIDITPFKYQSDDGGQELFKVLSNTILRKIVLGGVKNDIGLETNSYGPLTRIIKSIPSDRIWFSTEDDLSVWNKIKAFVENHTEENWNWWPLRPRMRLLQKNQTRLHWRCHCNTHLWTEISIAQAEKYQFLLSLREGTQQNHLCKLRRRKTSTLAFLAGILHAAGSNSNPRVWFGSLGRSSGTSQQGTRTSSTGNVGQTSIRMTSQRTASSNPQPSQTGNNLARVDQLFVLFGVKGTRRTLELAQIDTYNYASDGEFFGDLKKEYRGLRGYLRYWFSVWQLSHCDFVKFEKSRADRIFFRRKEIPTDSNYEYRPKPPDAEDPPITPHEFEVAFALCSTQCLWSAFHDCIEPPSGTLAIERIPKRKSLFELSRGGSEVEPAWGLQAQHAVALTQVIFYHVLILTGPLGFWAWWQDQRPTDLQNAAVPLTTVAVLMSLFWSASGLLKISRQSV